MDSRKVRGRTRRVDGKSSSGPHPWRRVMGTCLETSADVTFQPGEGITGIALRVRGVVPGLDRDAFVAAAEGAKANCPVSKALAGTTITLDADLA